MSDPTAVRRAVAIALTEGAPAPAARRRRCACRRRRRAVGADAAQARDGGAPPTDPTVQHAAVAPARRAPAWQQAMHVRAAALHATAPSVPDAWTAPTDRASDAAAWPR